MRRRSLLAVPFLAPGVARGQGAWPSQPIHCVIPGPPGGATAAIAGIVAEAMAPLLGQPLVLDHRPLAAASVAKSPADGYALLLAGPDSFYHPLIERDPPFDPGRDLGFIGPIGDAPFALVVRRGLPTDLPGFIAHAKANPGRLNMASSGQGTTSHLVGAMFNRATGIETAHIPYRGSVPALADLVGGRVDYGFDVLPAVLETVRRQHIALVGVTAAARLPQMPRVPTLAAAGLPGFVAAHWWGVCCPAGVPAPLVERLSAALSAALAQGSTVQGLADQGCRAFSLTPEAFADYVGAETAKWSAAIAAAGLLIG